MKRKAIYSPLKKRNDIGKHKDRIDTTLIILDVAGIAVGLYIDVCSPEGKFQYWGNLLQVFIVDKPRLYGIKYNATTAV